MKKSVFVIFLLLFFSENIEAGVRCAAGDYEKSVGDFGNECVIYVREETGIEFDACNTEAHECYGQSKDYGLSVGQKPVRSAIIVFDVQDGMPVGHVGIVDSIIGDEIKIRDSNFVDYHIVGEHTINVNDYDILGYIYCDDYQDDSELDSYCRKKYPDPRVERFRDKDGNLTPTYCPSDNRFYYYSSGCAVKYYNFEDYTGLGSGVCDSSTTTINDDSQDGAPGEESDGGYDHKVGLEYVKISPKGKDKWENYYSFNEDSIPDIDVRVKVKRKGDHWHDSCVDVYFSHDKYFSAKKDDLIGSDCKKLASKKKYADQKEESFYFEDIDIEDEVKAGNNYYIFANITYSGGNNKSSRDNKDEYSKIDISSVVNTTTTTTINLPFDPELISNTCDYFEIWKTGDYSESEDLEIIFNPSFKSVYFVGQIRPNERWGDYPVDGNTVSISNWPKNQPIEFSVLADGSWLEANNCPEYSNGETNPIFRHFKLTFQKSIQNNIPTDETISSSCSYFQIIKTMDRGNAGDYQFVFSENFPENIILNGQKRPNDKWQDYQTVNKIVAVSNWPKGQPMEFSVKYYDAKNNLIWLDASKCPEYFNQAQNPNDQHFKVIFEN